MKANRFSPRAALVVAPLALLGSACPSGWSFEPATSAPMSVDTSTYKRYVCTKLAFERVPKPDETWVGARGAWWTRPRIHLHCANATTDAQRALCLTAPNDRDTPVLNGAETPVLSFVHLSDAQLKEHAVRMVGPYGDEVAYDGIISTANRDDDLESFDDSALLATVLGINDLDPASPRHPENAPMPPTFVMHTGDAVDAGMFSELAQFLGVFNQLNFPYLNAVGNHDNRFFGTFAADAVSGANVVAPFVPIGTTRRFMLFHSVSGSDEDVSLPFMRQQLGTGDAATQNVWGSDGSQPQTMGNGLFHGFDFACPTGDGLCANALGYYAFTVTGVDGTVFRMIVLNTSQVVPTTAAASLAHGDDGKVLPAQIEWLAGQLHGDGLTADQKKQAFYFVFGHHNFDSFVDRDQGDQIKRLMIEQPRVLAYVTGHTHVDDIQSYARPAGLPLWEIVGGSTLVYPQLGHVVEVLKRGSGENTQLVLKVQSFRQQLSDVLDLPYTAADGATLSGTALIEELEATCPAPAFPPGCATNEPAHGYCLSLAERAAAARRGAARDHDADKRNEVEAVKKSNGAMRVY